MKFAGFFEVRDSAGTLRLATVDRNEAELYAAFLGFKGVAANILYVRRKNNLDPVRGAA